MVRCLNPGFKRCEIAATLIVLEIPCQQLGIIIEGGLILEFSILFLVCFVVL